MESLIKQSFMHVDEHWHHVQSGHYDLSDPKGLIIPTHTWDQVIRPGWSITMHMWPRTYPSLADFAIIGANQADFADSK